MWIIGPYSWKGFDSVRKMPDTVVKCEVYVVIDIVPSRVVEFVIVLPDTDSRKFIILTPTQTQVNRKVVN